MNDEKKTKKQLIEELVLLRRETSTMKTSPPLVADQLSLILQSLPVSCFLAKPEAGTIYITENIKALTGFEAQDFISNPSMWRKRIHPEDESKIFSDISRLLEKGSYQYEYR